MWNVEQHAIKLDKDSFYMCTFVDRCIHGLCCVGFTCRFKNCKLKTVCTPLTTETKQNNLISPQENKHLIKKLGKAEKIPRKQLLLHKKHHVMREKQSCAWVTLSPCEHCNKTTRKERAAIRRPYG